MDTMKNKIKNLFIRRSFIILSFPFIVLVLVLEIIIREIYRAWKNLCIISQMLTDLKRYLKLIKESWKKETND